MRDIVSASTLVVRLILLLLSAIGGGLAGALSLSACLVMTHFFVALLRDGRGFLPELPPLVISSFGIHLQALSVVAILGAAAGSCYAVWKASQMYRSHP